MNVDTFLLYVGAVIVLCLTPGPNSLLAVTNGAKYGARRTLFSTFGCATGLFLLIAVCLTGLGVLIAASETAFVVLKVVGCIYLVWLGVTLIRDKSPLIGAPVTQPNDTGPSHSSLYLQGLLVVLGNPKVLLFFSAFLPQFYSVEYPYWSQLAILAGTFVLVEVCLEVCLATFAARISVILRSRRASKYFSNATGGLFVGAGLLLLVSDRPK